MGKDSESCLQQRDWEKLLWRDVESAWEIMKETEIGVGEDIQALSVEQVGQQGWGL